MELTKEHFDAMLIILYKLGEYEACSALLKAYGRMFHPKRLALIK